MNKILNYIIIFLLLTLLSCDYKPVLSYKNYQFSINVDKISGNEEINSIIINNFKNLPGDKEKYFIKLSSKKEKKILSKDSKGDPLIFEIAISVEYIVEKNGNTLIENNLERKTTYNNIVDKFELESYEKTIIDNLTANISDRIIFAISEMNE
tara:strand:+ start:20 stop:478 length:459 start_codon:yes stop_codon:yes gene_type:complete